MAQTQRSKAAAQHGATLRTKAGREVMEVSVLNICGPYTTEVMRTADVWPTTSSVPVQRPQPPVPRVTARSDSRPVFPSPGSKQLLQTSVPIRTGSPTAHWLGHSSGMCPLCLAGVSVSALKACLNITSLHHRVQKTAAGGPEAV